MATVPTGAVLMPGEALTEADLMSEEVPTEAALMSEEALMEEVLMAGIPMAAVPMEAVRVWEIPMRAGLTEAVPMKEWIMTDLLEAL